jgi:hypothetical protein
MGKRSFEDSSLEQNDSNAGYNLQWFDNPIQDGLRNLVGGKEK